MEDGSDLKNALFCRMNLKDFFQKYDIKKAKLKARLKKGGGKKRVDSPARLEAKPIYESVTSHRRSFDASSVESLLVRREVHEDPIMRRMREETERKAQLVMDQQTTLEVLDFCSKALSNPVLNIRKLYQALFMLDGSRVHNIKDIPGDCQVLVLSEQQNAFKGLHNTSTLSDSEAHALELRAMFKTVKQKWLA